MNVTVINNALRQQILASQTVRSTLKTRLYPSELAQLKTKVYPLANFKILEGYPINRAEGTISAPLQIWTWSKTSYDEASEIIAAIQSTLAYQRFQTTEVRIVISDIQITPQQLYDDEGELYGYVMRLQMLAIER